jgi:hypothetical protein
MRREWLAAINGIHHPYAVLLHGAGSPGESPCCLMIALLMLEFCPASMGAVQRRGRRNATDSHFLNVFARAIGRSIPPAVCRRTAQVARLLWRLPARALT